jgi:putative peptidoglycan lipid II flippase
MVARLLASFLPEGAVTYLYYSQRLIEMPMGIFAVAIATASMPTLSQYASNGEFDRLKAVFSDSLRMTFFIVIPASAALFVIGEPIISILFQRGRFTASMTSATYEALFGFTLSLWAAAGVRQIVPVFYAMKDSKTPAKVAAACLLVYLVAGLSLMWPLEHLGLALAISLSTIVNFTLLTILLRRRLGPLGLRSAFRTIVRSLAASAIMSAVAWALCRLVRLPGLGRGWPRGGVILGAVLVAIVVYFLAARLLRMPEVGELLQAVRRRRRPAVPAERTS